MPPPVAANRRVPRHEEGRAVEEYLEVCVVGEGYADPPRGEGVLLLLSAVGRDVEAIDGESDEDSMRENHDDY